MERPAEEPGPSAARDYRLSPRKVAMWSAVTAVAAVVALIAVAVINDADALNTVALYLAVIAFVAQLIMYVAQNESSARQLKESQDVQRETSMMLKGIQEASASTQRLLNEQYNVVINALVDRAAAAVGEDADGGAPGPTPEALEELREGLRAEFAETAAEAVQRYAAQSRVPVFSTSGPPSGEVVGRVTRPVRGQIGANIRAARRAAGLTQEEVAQASGMGQAHFSRIEQGRIDVGATTLMRIAQALNVAVAELLDDARETD